MEKFIVYLVFALLYLWLMYKASRTYPVLYLFLFTYFLQYAFSTYLIYNDYKILGYQMPIKQEEYFAYLLPALASLFGGALLFSKNFDIQNVIRRINPAQAGKLGYLLLMISFGFDLVEFAGFSFISSITSFTSFLKYPAAFCFLFSNVRNRYLLIGFIYLLLTISVLRGGVFVTLFIWSAFLFFFIILRFRISYWVRIGIIVPAAFLLILVQSVKQEYREATWEKNKEGGVGLITDLAEKKNQQQGDDPFSESEGVVRTIGRLSQGWHLGLTLKWVPKNEPFSNGNEFFGDIVGSFLPRIIFSGKKIVGSQGKFYRYTGHRLYGSTSMTIGVLGDFYINFGYIGSFFMLFAFGALIAFFLNYFIRRFVWQDPINIVWIPFMFNYLIRANNDFYMVFNAMTKGFIIFLMVNYLRKLLMATPRPRGFRKSVSI